MKLSNKISLIAAIAGLAVIGTGYAAWTFSSDATASSTGNVSITTKDTEVGTLTVDTGSFYLVLDQKFLGWSTTADVPTEALDKVTLTYDGADANAPASNTGWAITETINFSVEFTNALSSYVTVSGGSFADASMTYTGTAITNEYTLPEVSWVDGMKPENETEYDAMVTALSGKTVAFTFSAEVAECTH